MFLESFVSIFSHQMVDFMCSFGFGVLCFALQNCLPRDFVFDWVIGWDYSMFLCRGAQLLGASPRFEAVLGELDLGISFNLSTFNILNWKATEITSFSLSLAFCVMSQHLYVLP